MKSILLLFLFPLTLLAQKKEALPQDLTGVWTGYLYNDTTRQRNDYELAISENRKKLSGYTYTIFLIDGKKNIGVKSVKIKAGKEMLFIEDEKLIDNNYDAPPARGVRTFIELHYAENDTTEILRGSWKTNITREYNSVTGNVFLERKKHPEATAIIPKLRQLNLLGQLSFLPASGSLDEFIAKSHAEEEKVDLSRQKADKGNASNFAAIVKNENQSSGSEKIIPDTTITNPEINIYMFPKNDFTQKDGSQNNDRKNVLAKSAGSSGAREDILAVLSGREDIEKAEKESIVSETLNSGKGKTSAKTTPIAITGDVLETKLKHFAQDSLEGSKQNETVRSVPLTAGNFIENDSRSLSPQSIATSEIVSGRNQVEQEKATLFNNQKEIVPLDTVLSVRNRSMIDPSKAELLAVKNRNSAGTDRIQLIDSLASDTKKKSETVLSPVDDTGKPESVAQNKIVAEKSTEEEMKKSFSSKEMELAVKTSAPKIITKEMLSAREIETIRIVEIERDTLIFSLFDNGVIDGDTVSVLLNGEVIMSKIGLLARAYNDTVYLTPDMGDSIHIILYAENLGSIAPNTGLLVVREGKMNHEIRFSGDLKKNSAIILKRIRHAIEGN